MKSITQPRYNDVVIKSDTKTGHPGKFGASNNTSSGELDDLSNANT